MSLQSYNQWTRPNAGLTDSARREGIDNLGGLGKRLVFSTRARSPLFKVLLFPYEFGEALPLTNFTRHSDTSATLTVSFPDGEIKDEFVMTTNTTTGRTQFTMSRNGKHVVDV